MSNFKLVSHYLCPYVQRAFIVLAEKEISHDRIYIDLSNKPDWFLEISPLGKVPLLIKADDNGEERVLFESQVIAEYLDEVTEGSLLPADAFEKARQKSWIEFASNTLGVISQLYRANDLEAFEVSKQELYKKLTQIESEVKAPFFAGGAFHLIDGVYGTIFRYLDVLRDAVDLNFIEEGSTLAQWRDNVMHRESVINAVPENYAFLLKEFIKKQNSYLARLLAEEEVRLSA